MKTKAFFLVALTAALMTSCMKPIRMITESAKNEIKAQHEYRDSEKWGKVVEKQIEFESLAFSQLKIDGSVEVYFTQDSICSVKAYGNEKAIDEYVFKCNDEDGSLIVTLKKFENDKNAKHNIDKDTPAITIYVSAPSLTKTSLNGAGDIKVEGSLKQTEDFTIDINGAGDFDAKELEVASFNAVVNGAGDISIKDIKCDNNTKFVINGAGDVDAKLKCANAKVQVNGAGDIKLDVKCNDLTAECNGVGDIKLKGECNKLKKNDGAIGGVDSRNLKVNNKVDIEKK